MDFEVGRRCATPKTLIFRVLETLLDHGRGNNIKNNQNKNLKLLRYLVASQNNRKGTLFSIFVNPETVIQDLLTQPELTNGPALKTHDGGLAALFCSLYPRIADGERSQKTSNGVLWQWTRLVRRREFPAHTFGS